MNKTQIALGAMLIAQAFYNGAHKQCPGKRMLFGTRKTIFTAGMLTGVTLCPPLLLAISLAMENNMPIIVCNMLGGDIARLIKGENVRTIVQGES